MSDIGVGRDQLRAFVERIERLEDEVKAINDDKSEVYKEARGNGFDVKVMRKIIADRRKDPNERQEFEAVYDAYAAALGMLPATRARTETVLMQEPHDEAEGQGGVVEHSSAEGSQALLPSDPVENKAVGPSVIAAEQSPEPANVFELKRKPLRPHCLKPDRCGAMGAEHCWTCTKAMNSADGNVA